MVRHSYNVFLKNIFNKKYDILNKNAKPFEGFIGACRGRRGLFILAFPFSLPPFFLLIFQALMAKFIHLTPFIMKKVRNRILIILNIYYIKTLARLGFIMRALEVELQKMMVLIQSVFRQMILFLKIKLINQISLHQIQKAQKKIY